MASTLNIWNTLLATTGISCYIATIYKLKEGNTQKVNLVDEEVLKQEQEVTKQYEEKTKQEKLRTRALEQELERVKARSWFSK